MKCGHWKSDSSEVFLIWLISYVRWSWAQAYAATWPLERGRGVGASAARRHLSHALRAPGEWPRDPLVQGEYVRD